ncbi:YCF48-related protein [Azoarcus sp. KH32C]|uniref:WD40/YVTN/BNR-like repeat-containing protein n=1 Tax=Azoarcus sp. KH32C TaxID=748247 RepID=UPI00034CD70A|nr:YCF48-related protein [Azoarcus sp. KH32C]
MMMSITRTASVLACCVLAGVMQPAAAADFVDPLDAPSVPSALAAGSLITGLSHAGERVVAVGQRGHVLVSGDGGKTWAQAQVPVKSDLVAVSFPTPLRGWAVGHDGVVLATSDGGANWVRQFDGRSAARAMADHYANASAELAQEAERFVADGPDKPFLDVWFENETTGYIVGAFNLIFRTEDGGKTWVPWFDRTENPRRLHLHAVRGFGKDVFIVGEQGLVLKLDRDAGRFRAVQTPYNGSYFGITGKDKSLIVFGLRGNTYRSVDGGVHWAKIETNTGGAITAADVAPNGDIVLAGQDGTVFVSTDDGASFSAVEVSPRLPTSALLVQGRDDLILAGIRGLRVAPVKTAR